MFFVPNYLRQRLLCLASIYAVLDRTCFKEIIEWIGSCIHLGKVTQKRNLEEKLLRRGIVRKCDWRKGERLFKGWGYGVVKSDVVYVVKRVAKRRAAYWVKKIMMRGQYFE